MVGLRCAISGGTLRVVYKGVDTERRMVQFHVYRRDTGEDVGFTHTLLNGDIHGAFDADVFFALEPLPEGSQFMLWPVQFDEHRADEWNDREAA